MNMPVSLNSVSRFVSCDQINIDRINAANVSNPVSRIIQRVLSKNHCGRNNNHENGHDYYSDQPSYDHYRDD